MNADAKVTIDVTAEDIAKGCRNRSQGCPIARAAERVGFDDASASVLGLFYGPDRSWPEPRPFVRMPEAAKRFMMAFDEGRDVVPFSFEVDAPEPRP